VLPNTSGLNANHRPADFAAAFRSLRRAALGTISSSVRCRSRAGAARTSSRPPTAPRRSR
jgi:hypothetical protein